MKRVDYIKDPAIIEPFRKVMEGRCEGHMFVKKLKNDFKIYCSSCHEYHHVSNDLYYQISKSHICPFCYDTVQLHKKRFHQYDWTIGRLDSTSSAYYVIYSWDFGQRKPTLRVVEVVRYEEDYIMKRYVSASMYNIYFDESKYTWKKATKSRIPGWVGWIGFIDENYIKPKKNKKQFITEAVDRFFNKLDSSDLVKSNQKKLLMDNLFNANQISFILTFDLKTPEEVYKYNGYIRKSAMYKPYDQHQVWYDLIKLIEIDEEKRQVKQLNVHYLDYLYRRQIPLVSYIDYAEQCKRLNYKLDKPTDFNHRHAVLSGILAEKDNVKNDNKIKKRYKKLKNNSYENKKTKITIKPFESCKEIIYAAKYLQNCLATNYLKPYAEGKTDLYHLDVDGVMLVAIEVEHNTLRQANTVKNTLPDPKYRKVINNWVMQLNKTKGEKANA